MDNTIYVSKHLTSTSFYEDFLKQLERFESYHSEQNPILFDFSNCYKVEPLCLANILILGNSIQERTQVPIKIFIPDTVEGGSLKAYLWKMGFLANSQIIKEGQARRIIFDYVSSPYGGAEGVAIDPVCGTAYFEKGLREQDIENKVKEYLAPFISKYLQEFQISEDKNIITEFFCETAKNCVIHGNSNAYVTMHGRHSDHRIYISVADYGRGFLASWKEEKEQYQKLIEMGKGLTPQEEKDYGVILETEKNYIGHAPEDEYEAILCGIYKRKQSKIYGLYNIIKLILERGKNYKKEFGNDKTASIVRIHSNDTQIILTDRLLEQFESGVLDRANKFDEYNVKKGRNFKGVHIEIEIPFIWKGKKYV